MKAVAINIQKSGQIENAMTISELREVLNKYADCSLDGSNTVVVFNLGNGQYKGITKEQFTLETVYSEVQ